MGAGQSVKEACLSNCFTPLWKGAQGRMLVGLYVVISLAYIYIMYYMPVAIWPGAGHDDGYFISCAESIASGNWLGEYSQMRLIKGPGYPLFLAASHILGIPLLLSTALLYLTACAATVWALRKLGLGALWALCLFALVLFQPMLFPHRVIRDYVNAAFAVWAFCGIIQIVFLSSPKQWLLGLSGLACGFFVITRDDAHWLIAPFILLLIFKLCLVLYNKKGMHSFLTCLLLYVCCAMMPPFVVSSVNKYTYGLFAITDFKTPSFKKALSSLYRVSEDEVVRHVPVTRKTMKAIYAVSPAFRQLEPFFEGSGLVWTEHAKNYYKYGQGEYFAGWFIWALRDGVSSLGHYSSPQAADSFYQTFADEIDQACADGRLKCRAPGLIAFMPPLAEGAWKEILPSLERLFDVISYTHKSFSTGLLSSPDNEDFQRIRRFLGISTYYPHSSTIEASGWYYTSEGSWFVLESNGKRQDVPRKEDSGAASDGASADPRAMGNYFSFSVPASGSWRMVFDEQSITPLSVNSLKLKANINNSDNELYIDALSIPKSTMEGGTQDIPNSLMTPYYYINHLALFLGLLATLLGTVLCLYRKALPSPLLLISYGFWLAACARAGLLLMVHISSFPTLFTVYALPIPVFVLFASVSSVAALGDIFRKTGRTSRPAAIA